MFSATGLRTAGVVEHVPHQPHDTVRRRQSARRASHRRASAYLSGRPSLRDSAGDLDGITMDRLTYLSTALDALPGIALREYFVPIVRLKKQLLLRQRSVRQRFPSRATADGAAAYAKLVEGAMGHLTKALSTAAGDLMLDGGTSNLTLEVKDVMAHLKDKLTPVCFEAGGVFAFPREPPEASFVYIIVAGTVSANYFQPQSQSSVQAAAAQQQQQQQCRGGGGGGGAGGGVPAGMRKGRPMYFTSAKEVVRLCGGGLAPEAAMHVDDYAATESVNNNSAGSPHAGDGGATSMSGVTTAIQRSLRRASRTVGQPTLQPTRTETVRAPAVLGATEALGLLPSKYVCYTASSTSVAGSKGARVNGATEATYVEFVDAFRLRTLDVHAALVSIAAQQQAERQQRTSHRAAPWCAAGPGEVVPRGVVRTVADFVVAARRRALYSDYAATELLMRQSWLLQDAPAHTIRTLISHLVPRTYMPGEVVACPHTPGSERQLCFLRRGRFHVFAVPRTAVATVAPVALGESQNGHGGGRVPAREGCTCWRIDDAPAEAVDSGASFGELSVLFHEPRHCLLRADTVCDVWCLPHRSFTALMQRDSALRDGLLQKAAVLRIEWMGEQRYTRALAQQLRACSELLRPLSDMAIRLIQERLEPVVHPPGSLVASTSTRCAEMTFIMRGTVSTICEGVATYTAGDVLGEGCLMPHRWPLGLAARTMVEGWRIRVDQLLDALRRMDVLHQYSGIVTSQTPQLMKRIFGTPQPEIEVDAVGRQRMPTVGPPPGGFDSYLAYGRAVSEVQLRALCFLYGDYVRWEDINYASMDSGATRRGATSARSGAGAGSKLTLDSVARGLAVSRLNGGQTQSVSAALGELQPHLRDGRAAAGAGPFAGRVHPRAPSVVAAGGSADVADPLMGDAAAAGSGRSAARLRSAQSARRGGAARAGGQRSGSCHGPTLRVSNAGAFLIKDAFLGDGTVPGRGKARGGRAAGAKTAAGAALADLPADRHTTAPALLPRLQRMARLIEERNRAWAAEQRHEAALAQQETNQRDAAVRDQALLRTTAAATAAANTAPSSRGAKASVTASATHASTTGAARGGGGGVAGMSPAPVHIFLLAEKPKYELTISEAIAIGYVMQLPDIGHIQHSVSLVDPDVALGPPSQRARRHLMAVTPNDRYTKHNFLFAAAALEDGNSAESLQKAAEAQAEATVRSKTRKLYTMMRTAVASHMDEQAAAAAAVVFNPTSFASGGGGGDCTPLRGSIAVSGQHARPAADTLVLTDELHVRSPELDAATRDTSLSATAFTPSPERPGPYLGPSHQSGLVGSASGALAAARGDSMAVLSPFGGSPAKSAAQRKEEAFRRLLQREPVQAVDLLRKHYEVPWTIATAVAAGVGPMASLSTPTRRGADMRSSATGSVHASSPTSTAAEPTQQQYQHRRSGGHSQRPSLLTRLEGAAGCVYACEASSGSAAATPPPALSRSASAGAAEAVAAAAARRGSETDTEAGSHANGAGSGAFAAAAFPQLVRAAARDRWHGINQLSAGSAPPPSSPSHAAAVTTAPLPRSPRAGAADTTSAPLTPSSTASAPAAPGGNSTLVEHFYRSGHGGTAPALFVEGYGPLQPLPDELAEYPPTIHATAGGGAAAAAGDALLGSGGGSSEGGVAGSASRFARAATSVVAAAVLRRSASRPRGLAGSHLGGGDGFGGAQLHSPFGGRGGSVTGGGAGGPGSGAGGGRGGPHMEVFVMPDPDDTEVLIRRIQRDVNALNAVAGEQRRERAGARGGPGGAHGRRLLEAALGQPNADELELLEVWRQHYRHVANEGLRRASLPVALRGEAGPDYMKQELEHLAYTPAPMDDPIWRYSAGVQEWQEQQQQAVRADCSSFASGQLGALAGGGAAQAGVTPDGPRRVVAAVGAASLGFNPVPLQSPSALLAPAEYDAWVRQREDFFSAYKRLLGGDAARGGRLAPSATAAAGAAAAAAPVPLTAPALRFTPALAASGRRRSHSPTNAAGQSPAPPSEAFAGPAADFRTGVYPRSEDSDAFDEYVHASAGGAEAASSPAPRFGALSTPGTDMSSAQRSTPDRAASQTPPTAGGIPQVVLGAAGPLTISGFAGGGGTAAAGAAVRHVADDTQPWSDI